VQLFLIKYGLLAVFLASALEADVVPVLAGVAAHRECFNSALGIAAACAGAFAGDCVWFSLGRYKAIGNSSVLLRVRSKSDGLIRRLGVWQIPASHVVYGTRVATMVLMGARGISFTKFALIDALGCLVLTALLFSLGFAFSASASIVLGHIRRIELLMLVAAALFGLFFHLLQKLGPRTFRGVATGGRDAEGR
jgi:membrane protein DedA with SNARE-associated domain